MMILHYIRDDPEKEAVFTSVYYLTKDRKAESELIPPLWEIFEFLSEL